jgi:AraC-like DNA-binding protein
MKNGFICLITQLCRIAIEFGVDNNFSYALSDYYIKELENKQTTDEVYDLVKSVLLHYYDLVHRAFGKNYSKPVNSAIRFIEMNLYNTICVAEIAEHVHLEKHYFATLFKSQTGYTPTEYVRKRKLAEAKRILDLDDCSITEVAENLCFCDTPFFSRCFKEEYHITPRDYKKGHRPDALSI